MSDGPLSRWRTIQQKRKERFYERSFKQFKGKIFVVIGHGSYPAGRPGPWLLIYSKTKGLLLDSEKYFELSAKNWNRYAVPKGENVLATGKVVLQDLKVVNKLIIGFEVLTTKGVGYLAREDLKGPMVKHPDGTIGLQLKDPGS